MSVNTDIIGGGLPAARAATSSRTRAQSSTASSALPRSLARSASPRPIDATAGWAGDRDRRLEAEGGLDQRGDGHRPADPGEGARRRRPATRPSAGARRTRRHRRQGREVGGVCRR